jgi:hypothetical protein
MRSYDTFVVPANERRVPDGHDLSVTMFEWARTDANSRALDTVGLACCVGVAAYDRSVRTAYLAHFFSLRTEDAGAEAFFDSIASTSKDPSSIKVWMRGGNATPCGDICPYDCRDMPDTDMCRGVMERRELAVTSLLDRGLSPEKMDIQWNNTRRETGPKGLRTSVNMSINRRGKFKSELIVRRCIEKIGAEAIKNLV